MVSTLPCATAQSNAVIPFYMQKEQQHIADQNDVYSIKPSYLMGTSGLNCQLFDTECAKKAYLVLGMYIG